MLLSLPPNGSAQERNPQALKALETLKQKIGNAFNVEWSEKQSKKIASLSLPEEVTGTPEKIATAFLQNNSELFQISEREEPILAYSFHVNAAGERVSLWYLIDANTGEISSAADTRQTALEKTAFSAQSGKYTLRGRICGKV